VPLKVCSEKQETETDMYFKQFYLGCLAHASYLIGDERTGKAVVVDPQRDVAQYLEEAERNGLTIEHVFLTHFHADFIAGHLELRDRVGAKIHLSANAQAEYDFEPAADGGSLELGDVRLEFLETPGHTNEAVSIVVYDRAKHGDAPYAVLTGDTLFIGDVGRPDLMASIGVTADELGAMLYDSLHEKLLKLPDETLVYPAHGAGSLCGKQLSSERSSTIGEQRRDNYALQPMTKEAFVELVTADQPAAPPYFLYDATMNRKQRPNLSDVLERELTPLAIEAMLRQQNAGAQVIDTRDPVEFAAGHLVQSLNIPLSGRYATWAGFLVDREQPVLLIANAGQEEEAALRLGRIGFDVVAGYLEGGMQALANRPELVERVQRVAPENLADELDHERAPYLVDVRTADEWAAGHIAGSVNVPLQELRDRVAELPRGRRIAVYCETGERSSMAASVLQRETLEDVRDLEGGLQNWRATDQPVATAEAVS